MITHSHPTYAEFLSAKGQLSTSFGFEVSPAEVNPALKPFNKDIVRWAIHGGRRAIFAAFGLHKTVMQLEIMRLLAPRISRHRLIVTPLGVRQEFKRDAELYFNGEYSLKLKFIRSAAELEGTDIIYLTNYESIRDGKLDVSHFEAVSLDEASILRGFGGTKTFREFMRLFEGSSTYRFVATATPSPNEYIELLAYAAFLEVMDVGQAKTRFFKRNSEKADQLTIHAHKEKEFWFWISTWAIFLQRPSDLGYSDEGYTLPEMDIHWYELPSTHKDAGHENSGQARLLRNSAINVQNAAREKRESLDIRVAKLLELRAVDPEAHRLIWHDLEREREALEDALPRARYHNWLEFKDGNSRGLELYERHYSAYQYADGRERELFCGPGQKTVLLTADSRALFVWRKFVDDSGQQGVNCAVFRNEGDLLSSDLIKEAMAIGWARWPGERFYTYVDAEKVASDNPGYCFIAAGWNKCGKTKNGKLIFEALPGVEVPTVERHATMVSVYGNQPLDDREHAIIEFSEGRIQEKAGKPSMLGSGCNFQRHCWWSIFLGIGFKFNDFVQAIHRVQRFGQTRRVRLDLIYTEAEREVRRILEQKWQQHIVLTERMSEIIRTYGLASNAIDNELKRSIGVAREEVRGERFVAVHNDCVIETARMEPDSVHLVMTSIPFSTQYEYTPSYNDFGHTDSNDHFFEQMDYLTPELLRVLQPGRVAAIHVKDRIVPGGLTGLGFQTVYPFSDETVAHFRKHGFALLGRKTIATDVVRENNQTYRLGWSEQCKDGSRMGAGMPEYLLLFRKPPTDSSNGYADVPVVKSKAEYSRSRWQIDAHGFMRSSGNRLLTAEDLRGIPHEKIFKLFRQFSSSEVYDYEHHVALSESLERCVHCQHIHTGDKRCGFEDCTCTRNGGILPTTFMLLQPQSTHPDVMTDITRMLSLNSAQSAAGREMHLCPLQFDLVDRVITQFSMKDEVVYDPFMGLGTVPLRAVKLGRRGRGSELHAGYFHDAVGYLRAAEAKVDAPSLFDALPEMDTLQEVGQ